MSNILPPSTSRTEHNMAKAGANAQALPIPLRSLWSPWTCPANLLPYLAASWSVDRWDDKWSEATKRQVIANSYFVHSRKGTVGAIRRVIEPMGFLVDVVEWWQTEHDNTPGTFSIDLRLNGSGISEELHEEIENLIHNAKPMTRHITGINMSMQSNGGSSIGAEVMAGDKISIHPELKTVATNGGANYGCATVINESLRILPTQE